MFNSYRNPSRPHKVTEVYITQVLYAIATALIAVFIPIYLLQLGYSLQQAFLFLIISKITVILVTPFVGWIDSKIGYKHTMILRIPFFLTSYLTLYELSFTNIHFFIPAIFAGLSTTLYWIPLHTLFVRYSHNKNRGAETGLMYSLPAMFKIAAPAIGGIVAATLGFPVLILIALGMVCLSTVPMFVSPDIKSQTSFSFKDLWDLRHHTFVSISLNDGFGFVATAYLFPILIYKTLGSTESLGYIISLGTLIFALVTLGVGRLIDKKDVLKWFGVGAALFGATIFFRPLFTTAIGFAGIIILGALSNGVYHTAHHKLFYDFANSLGGKADEFIIAREIFLNLGRIIMLGLAIMLPWTWGFIIAGVMIMMQGRLLKESPLLK